MTGTATALLADNSALAALTEDAIHAIAKLVQDKIGQTDGGIAGVHFSDDKAREQVAAVISRYLASEAAYEDEDAAPACITTRQHRNDGRGMCIDCDTVLV